MSFDRLLLLISVLSIGTCFRASQRSDDRTNDIIRAQINLRSVNTEVLNQDDYCLEQYNRCKSEHSKELTAEHISTGTSSSRERESVINEEEVSKRFLTVINNCRKKHDAQDLKTDDHLTKYSRKWAKSLSKKNKLEHGSKSKEYGESILKFSFHSIRSVNIGVQTVDKWCDRANDYNFTTEPNDDSHAHFTQMVWKGTKALGVGIAVNNETNYMYVVLAYEPRGNIGGEFLKNVVPEDKASKHSNISQQQREEVTTPTSTPDVKELTSNVSQTAKPEKEIEIANITKDTVTNRTLTDPKSGSKDENGCNCTSHKTEVKKDEKKEKEITNTEEVKNDDKVKEENAKTEKSVMDDKKKRGESDIVKAEENKKDNKSESCQKEKDNKQ